jgi:hypothetical protein
MLMEAGLEDADPLDPCAVISTDISNAFNEVGRDVIFQILLDAADSEGPWMDDLPAGQDLPVPPLLPRKTTYPHAHPQRHIQIHTLPTHIPSR